MYTRSVRFIVTLCCVLSVPAARAAAQTQTGDLGALTMEQLLGLPIATPSRLPQTRMRTPASAFVITDDDIRASGATTLAELLRVVPGLHVAQIDGNKWAIGSRGFTDRLARAMLVMIDGRAVYSPLFAGTYWEAQDVPLQDIERIEVIRGPGGALWGANAVTGIINIIRKSAAQSEGFSLKAGSGTSDPALVEAGYGGGDERWQFRVSGKALGRSAHDAPVDAGYDDARFVGAGARIDWRTDSSAGSLQADVYRTTFGQRDAISTISPPSIASQTSTDRQTGAHIRAQWIPEPGNPRGLRVQTYLDRTSRTELQFEENQTVFDVDAQEGVVAGRHGLLWGAGYRVTRSDTVTRGLLRFTQANRTSHLLSAFAADEIHLARAFDLTVGTKIEHNTFSGLEWQPSARLLWTPTATQAVSASVTRAVRTPSRVEHDFGTGSLLSPQGPVFVSLLPNPRFEAEVLTAWELSFVSRPQRALMWTVALFRNRHDRAMSVELGAPVVESDAAGTRLTVPVEFGNGLEGESTGVETTVDVRPTHWWRTTFNYSYLDVNLRKRPGSQDAGQEARAEGISPRHQVQLVTSVRAGARWSATWFLRAIGALPAIDVPAYATSDLNVEWRARQDLSLFASGRNLHHDRHVEFAEGGNGAVGIHRSVMVGLRWRR